MRKTAFIFSIILLLSSFCLSVSAESSEVSVVEQVSSGSNVGWDIVIVSIGMFVTISVVGVMFIKTVMKNNNNKR